MKKITLIGLCILTLLFVNGCKKMDDYCDNKVKCMENIAREHCKENDCIVIDVGNMLCGKQTTILNKKTREKIDFHFLPEDYDRCGLS